APADAAQWFWSWRYPGIIGGGACDWLALRDCAFAAGAVHVAGASHFESSVLLGRRNRSGRRRSGARVTVRQHRADEQLQLVIEHDWQHDQPQPGMRTK